jgi:RimJ/RimL family protein N-acetyltransferase
MVRAAQVPDAKGIVALYNAVAAEGVHITPERYPWPPEAEGQLINEARKSGSGRFVAVRNRRVIGECSIYRETMPKRAHTATCQMAVRKTFRGKGIGRLLLEKALEWAAEAGIEKVTLSVFSTNTAALELYRASGFEVEGVRKRQLRIKGEYADDILMAKFITTLP